MLLGGAAIVAIVGIVFVVFHRTGSSSTAAITALSSLAGAAIGGIAGWLTAARGAPTASVQHPTITLTPNIGAAGAQFTVNGSGFASGEAVHITFGATALTAATASQGGSFAQAQTVPAGTTQGPVVVTATGQTGSAAATAAFNVT